MKLHILDHTGHTPLDLDAEAMVKELEREMNRQGKAVVAEAPGLEPQYLRDPGDARKLPQDATVTVMPQLAGGSAGPMAALVESGEHIGQFFAYDHLPAPLQSVSAGFAALATTLVLSLPRNPERTVALRKLLEAKDAAVRAKLAK